jgi:hypothetical protein
MNLLKLICLTAVLLLAAASLLLAASPDMQPGKWNVTMKMEMTGAPFPMPPITFTQCITKDDLNDPKKTVPNSSKDKSNCEVKDYKMSGNKATWRMQCKDGSTGKGEMTYKSISYSGVMTMESMDKRHGKSTVVQRISGKRTGECK